MPWIGLQISTDGKIAPCCEFDGNVGSLAEGKLLDAWQGSKLHNIRKQFALGNKVKECWKCHDREVSEGNSMRLEKNNKFSNGHNLLQQAPVLLDVAPKHPIALDLRFSNLCNFKCRSCWHGASSKWFSDAKTLGNAIGDAAEIKSFSSVSEATAQIGECLESVEEIYFAGGEPLIQKEHYALLTQLCDKGLTNVALDYNTNLSVMSLSGQSIFDLWKKFDKVTVTASVDGSGELGEYLRTGFEWNTFVSNIKLLKEKCPHVKILYGITVSVLNIQALPDLIRSLRYELNVNLEQLHLHSLQSPNHYRTQILPTALKLKAKNAIHLYIDELVNDPLLNEENHHKFVETLHGLIRYMYAENLTVQIQNMRNITRKLDKIRSEDMVKTIPDLKVLLQKPSWWQIFSHRTKRLLKRALPRINRKATSRN
jgi:MoaA/NifB/PqqE/SkfB family radical SAM enzyme